MKNRFLIAAAIASAAVLSSCSSARYVVDHDTRYDFSGASSYAWFKLASPPDKATPPTERNSILTRRIRAAIDDELAVKGFEKTGIGEADLLVTYSLVLQSRMVMYHSGWAVPYHRWGWGWGWGPGWGMRRVSVDRYTEGTIILQVLDPKGRTPVWRGVVEGAFQGTKPNDERVAEVIARVLEEFPPS